MAVTRINNNQITDAQAGNIYVGINAGTKLQNYSITSTKISNNLVYGSDLTVTGNLTVQGNTTTIDTTIVTVEDPLLLLASGQTGSPAVDIGFIGQRGTSENVAFVWDESALEFATTFTNTAESNTVINITGYANLHANNTTVGGNLSVSGTTSLTGNITSALNVTGNITGNSILTAGVVSATGTITGGNIATGGTVSATGTATAGNLATGGTVSATGTITGGNINTGGNVSATGNVTAANFIGNISGNVSAPGANTQIEFNDNGTTNAVSGLTFTKTSNALFVGGTVSAVGTITGGNLATGGTVSATGDISGANLSVSGNVIPTANVTYNLGSLTNYWKSLYVSGNGTIYLGSLQVKEPVANTFAVYRADSVTLADLSIGGISATGNVTGGNLLTGGLISATGDISGAGIFGTTANVTFNATVGNLITGGVVSATGTVTGGNIATGGTVSAAGTATVGNVATGGTVSATGTITGGNLATGGTASATGNITGGNILTAGIASATGNISTSNFFIGNGRQLTGVTAESANAETLTGTFINSGVTGSSLTSVGTLTNLSVAGTATVGNLATGGTVSATGTATAGNVATGGTVSSTGNIDGGNLRTTGQVTASGNITGANVNSAQLYSSSGLTITNASGNVSITPAGNLVLANTYVNGVAYPAQDQDAASKIYVDNMVTTAIAYHEAVFAATNTTLATATGGTISYTQPNGVSNGVGAYIQTTGTFTTIDTANIQTIGTRILVKNEANAVLNGIYTYSNATAIVRATDADTYGPADPDALSINDYFFVTSGNVNAGSAYIVDAPSGTITFGTSNIQFAQFSQSQVYTGANGISINGTVISAKVDNNTTAFDGAGNIVVKAGANLTTPNIGAATGTSLSVTGAVDAGNIATGGTVSATGTVTGGNLATSGTISGTGNITGGNVLTGGQVSAAGNITAGTGSYFLGDGSLLTGVAAASVNAGNLVGNTLSANVLFSSLTTVGTLTSLSVSGTATAGNVATAGTVSATGTVTGGNIATGGTVSATGTATVGNVATGGTVSATGTVTGGNVNTGGTVSAFGTGTFGNLVTGGTASASGTITGGNLATGGTVSATGTVTGGNLETGGSISAVGSATVGNLVTGGIVSATSTVTGGNLVTPGTVSATGTATVGNLATGGTVSATGNILTGANVSAAGNVYATNFFGNISGNLSAPGANTQVIYNNNGTAAASAAFTFDNTSNAVSVGGNISAGNVNTAGTVSATGTVTGGYLYSSGEISAAGNVVANGNVNAVSNFVNAGAVLASGRVEAGTTMSATGNITGANLILTTGIVDGPTSGRIRINGSGIDTDFAVNGASTANVFYVDAGTGTASFGNATQTVNSIVSFNTTNSIKVPVGTTVERPTGVTGQMRFNSSTNNLEIFDNSQWTQVGAPTFTLISDQQFNGDGSTVAFTLSANATTAATIVSINGVQQIPTTAYAVSGTTLTFTEAPAQGDLIDVRSLTTTTTVTSIQNGSGNAIVAVSDASNVVTITGRIAGSTGTLTVQGDLTVTGNATITGNVATNSISNGTSRVEIPTSNGNVNIDVGATNNMAVFAADGVYVTGNVSATGDIIGQNVNSLSDATLKTNIQPISGIESVLFGLKGVEYDWKNGTGHSYGFLAQEVEQVLPSAVRTGPDGMKSVNYQMIIPFLVETIKQMGAEIQDLKKTVSSRGKKK